jgi:hypothetical protein
MFTHNKNKTIEILESLANGINPTTGEIFPDDSPYQETEIVRALFNAINELKNSPEKKANQTNRAANQGNKWTQTEDEQLIERFKKGIITSELSKLHGRTYGAIRSRLIKLELIKEYQ